MHDGFPLYRFASSSKSRSLLPRAVIVIYVCLHSTSVFAEANVKQWTVSIADPTDSAGEVLDKMQRAGDEIVDRATSDGSLVASKIARDIQILLADARQYLHEELTTSLNDLGDKELSLLAEMDGFIKVARDTTEKGKLIEEKAYLDLNQLAEKFPFTSETKVLRSVKGTSLIYRAEGTYRLKLIGNVFRPDTGEVGICKMPTYNEVQAQLKLRNWDDGRTEQMKIELCKRISSDLVFAAGSDDSEEFNLDINAAYTRTGFLEDKLAYISLAIKVQVPDGRHWYSRWPGSASTRTALFPFTIQLLPKHPITKYSLIARNAIPGVNRDVTLIAKGDDVIVPAVPHGSNAWAEVCARTPGLVGEAFEFKSASDSPPGNYFGSFIGQPAPKSNVEICQTYHTQCECLHTVSLTINYHPPMEAYVRKDVRFQALDPDDKAEKPTVDADKLEFGRMYIAYFDNDERSFTLAMEQFNGEPIFATGRLDDGFLAVTPSLGPTARQVTLMMSSPFK